MLLDCGLMFPDADMLGIDLVLPDFTWLREHGDRIEGCIVTHGHEDHMGGLSFLLRELSFPIIGSALTLGLARNRIEEAGLLDRTELDRGQRQRAAAVRPVRLRVHPGHPLGAPRLRHRVPHAAGHDPPHRRLQARPHAGRRPAHRPRRDGRHRPERGRPAAPVRLDQRRPARPLPLGDVGRQGAPRPVPRARRAGASSPPASPATSTASSRSPTPPSPSTGWWPPSACRCEERAAGPGDGPAPHPRLPPARHRGRRRPRPRQGLRDLHRLAGRAHVGAGPHGGQREPLAEAHPRRHGDPQLAPDPGQRDERVAR